MNVWFELDAGGANDGLSVDFGSDLVEWGLSDDDGDTSSDSSISISLSLLFIDRLDGINGGVMVFMGDDVNDDFVEYFGWDLVGFC